MKLSNRISAFVKVIIIIGIIVVVVGSLITKEPEPTPFSATITGNITKTLSFNTSGDSILITTGSQILVGKYQVLGMVSQSKQVMVTLGYRGNEMPKPGTYKIQDAPIRGAFFGTVMEYSRVGEITSFIDALREGSKAVQYAATQGSIVLEKTDDSYSGHFIFTAQRTTSQDTIQVVATFANVHRESSK